MPVVVGASQPRRHAPQYAQPLALATRRIPHSSAGRAGRHRGRDVDALIDALASARSCGESRPAIRVETPSDAAYGDNFI